LKSSSWFVRSLPVWLTAAVLLLIAMLTWFGYRAVVRLAIVQGPPPPPEGINPTREAQSSAKPPLATDAQRERVVERARWEAQVLGRLGRSEGILSADPPFSDEAGIVLPLEFLESIKRLGPERSTDTLNWLISLHVIDVTPANERPWL